MESLSETPWDVVIEGTGVRQSLLALALSRSNKKVLHVDKNEYYGGAEAAFSLQEVDEWVGKITEDSPTRPFRNASLWKSDAEPLNGAEKLSFSRAYSLTLSPHIIYSKSKLLAQLVSSKVYKQLEFQAVGNWWIYDSSSSELGFALKRLPSGREDIFEDKSIDNRSKRSLMKFLKFVVDYENHGEVWEPHADTGLSEFLASQFKLPLHLQTVIIALALSLDSPEHTTVRWAIPRIAQHLTSIGVFGPGFGAVVPKWGGGAEIAQVACRAGAVGGGVYVLGTGIKDIKSSTPIEVNLANGEIVKTSHLSRDLYSRASSSETPKAISRTIAVVSSALDSLFESSVEGAPLAAVTVVIFPAETIVVDGNSNTHPVYIMVHSSETGECPSGQCVLYATTLYSDTSKIFLENAVTTFLDNADDGKAKALYKLHYEQEEAKETESSSPDPLDLAFHDAVLDDVECEWKAIIGDEIGDSIFMTFEERAGMNDEDDDDNEF